MAPWSRTFQWAVLVAGIAAAAAWLPDAAGQASHDKAKAVDKPPLKPGQIDVEKSRVYIRVGKKGLGHEHGIEGKLKSGSLDIQAQKNVGAIEFDMASFTADTDEARQFVELKGTTAESTREKVTEAMLGAAVLDVEQFPTATFKIKAREMIKNERGLLYVFKGDFTLHGQTKEIKVLAQPIDRLEKEGRWHVKGDFTILQSDFGITPYKAALGTVGVADELKIWGDVWIAGEAKQKK